MERYIDIHCHLLNSQNIEHTIKRAESIGCVGCLCNSERISDWQKLLDLTKRYDFVRGAIGIHPWNIMEHDITKVKNQMEQILCEKQNIMVGEIGLDSKYPDIKKQIDFFTTQYEIALKYRRVVSLHCVGAWDIILHIIKENRNTVPIIAHSFSGNIDIIKQLQNAYFSYSPMILNKKYKKMRDSVFFTPMDKILIESDGTDLTILPDIISEISKIKSMSIESVMTTIYNNSKRILK